MKHIPYPLRITRLVGVAVLAFLLTAAWRAQHSIQDVQAQSTSLSKANERARIQLRGAVASNNDAALQKVETDFPNTEEAALAHFLRGYLRLQAKDYANAIALL